MDSSDPQRSNSTGSPPNDIADNSPVMKPSKRDIFLSTYRHQNFTFPNSIMHYTAKNPKNAEVYEKMVKRCKYFFVKNPVLIVDVLYTDQDVWRIWINHDWKNIDMNKLLSKLWITYKLDVFTGNASNNSIVSSIIPKVYQCDVKYLVLNEQVISFHEFIFLCSSVKDLGLNEVTVKNDDGTVFLFEKIIEQLPKVKKIHYTFTSPSNNTSKTTFKELWKISHLSNYDFFTLYNISEEFDIDSFYFYMKINRKTCVYLSFSDAISEEYKTRLEAIIDEIIGAKNHKYKPPYINFPGLDREKLIKISAVPRG